MDEDNYNDSNRAFVQAFLARGSMTSDEAKPILAAILSARDGQTVNAEDITQHDLSSYIATANTALSPFDFEIRNTVRQIPSAASAGRNSNSRPSGDHGDGNKPERVYALVNTTSDLLTQLATTYSVDEIAFVKRILDAMFETNNTRKSEAMVISGTQAMQLAKISATDAARRASTNSQRNGQSQIGGSAAHTLSMTQAESVLKRVVEEGWFEKSRKGYYSLTPRALMELRGWLVAAYNEESDDGHGRNDRIKFCRACKDIVISGQRCANRDCPGRLHDHCVRNFFRIQRAGKCPICKADWTGNNFVGERAISNTNEQRQVARRSVNGERARAMEDSDEDAG